MVLNLMINEDNVTVTFSKNLRSLMKHTTGQTLVQSRYLIVSVSMFGRLPIVTKADTIRSLLMEINRFKMCTRSNHMKRHSVI